MCYFSLFPLLLNSFPNPLPATPAVVFFAPVSYSFRQAGGKPSESGPSGGRRKCQDNVSSMVEHQHPVYRCEKQSKRKSRTDNAKGQAFVQGSTRRPRVGLLSLQNSLRISIPWSVSRRRSTTDSEHPTVCEWFCKQGGDSFRVLDHGTGGGLTPQVVLSFHKTIIRIHLAY